MIRRFLRSKAHAVHIDLVDGVYFVDQFRFDLYFQAVILAVHGTHCFAFKQHDILIGRVDVDVVARPLLPRLLWEHDF